MTRAELQGALDNLAAGFINPHSDHPLPYWREELPPGAFAVLARRSKELADDLSNLARAEESARSVIGGGAK